MEQMPFYMTFPMQNLYVMELEYEKDMERMKSLYPVEVAKIQAIIEERCDELEYEGGRIFDEEPDRFMMQEEIMRLYERISQSNDINGSISSDGMQNDMKTDMRQLELSSDTEDRKIYFPEYVQGELSVQNYDRRNRRCDNWLCSMVGIMFTNELYRRRCRHRRCRRWW